MSDITTEIARIEKAKADLKTAIEAKGVTVGGGTIDTYPALVESIPSGSSVQKNVCIVTYTPKSTLTLITVKYYEGGPMPGGVVVKPGMYISKTIESSVGNTYMCTQGSTNSRVVSIRLIGGSMTSQTPVNIRAGYGGDILRQLTTADIGIYSPFDYEVPGDVDYLFIESDVS